MAYCTQTDIEKQLPESTLSQLTDDLGNGVVDTDAVDRAIADAEADIDAYCQGRYTLPLSPVPDKVVNLAVDIAIYNLYSRRDSFGMPEIRDTRYKNAIRFLEKVAEGKIKLGAANPAPTSSGNEVSVSSNDRVFDSDSLKGF